MIEGLQKFFDRLKSPANKCGVTSFESDIGFLRNYKNFGEVVVKKYKADSPCVIWLNQHLRRYYVYSTIMPIAQHEFRALEILNSNGVAPRPLEIGTDYIILEKWGTELKNPPMNLYSQAVHILKELRRLNFKHNDLLMRNILIDASNELKLIDLTLSEFGNVEIIKHLPNKSWAYPGDERILNYFK
ncbi:MAG: hypothetical protein K5780_01135 [Alphaproteobacteria bacterium]|nr:hypothetical protein [Alphaproteobacteria bacterium]